MDGDTARIWIQSVLNGDSQHGRLLTMDFPRRDAPKYAVMLVNTLDAQEEVSRGFRYAVEVLSDDAHIPLKDMMAKMITISLVRNDGSLRHFNGYVTEFRLLGADGGLARYHMVLEPWLAFARLRQNCCSFHGRTLLEITEMTLRPYLQHDWQTRIYRDDPAITCVNQYNETDYNHLHRRWEGLGWHYWYEHRANGHTLWLGDDSAMMDSIDTRFRTAAPDGMPFRSEAGSLEDDSIHSWQAARELGPGAVTLSSFNYKHPAAQHVRATTRYKQGGVAAFEIHEDIGAHGYHSSKDGEPLAQRRMDERETHYQYFEASGNDRNTQPGRGFKLEEHFSGEVPYQGRKRRDYLILSVRHQASNNYQDGRRAESRYANNFTCVRQERRWRPGRQYHSVVPPDPGVQTAIVTGPPGEEIYTDGLGRIKLQFHWDRVGNYDDGSSPWMRVVMPAAGATMGQIGLPRVGQEVMVQFVNGNVDHPVVTGVVYNGRHAPPWELPQQRALSGWRSRELSGGNGSNHLLLDDTRGELQAQLRSDHLHSQLSLGHIVRVENTQGRAEARGDGFELRTDGQGVLRAAKGILLTSEERSGARSRSASMEETLRRLDGAQQGHADLAGVAQEHDGAAAGQQATVVKALEKQQRAVAADLSSHLVLASPAGIASTTAGSTHIASEQHTALSCGKDLSLFSGESLFASVRHAIRLYVHKAGMKLVAAAGDIDLQTLTDSIRLLSKMDITQTANRIVITAKEEIVINGGGSYLKFSKSGIEQGTNGKYVAHAAAHHFEGPRNMDVAMVMPPVSKLKGKAALHLGTHGSASGRACKGLPCRLYKDDTLLEQTTFSEDGTLRFAHELEEEAAYHIELPNGQRFEIAPGEMNEEHQVSSGMGFHGYCNPGGSLCEQAPTLEQDRLDANPWIREEANDG